MLLLNHKIVNDSINAKLNNKVPLILPSTSGCLDIPSTALAAALPCPIPGPIAAKPTAKLAAITDAAEQLNPYL